MRTVREWIGRADDTPIPDSVKLRVLERHRGQCGECGVPVIARDLCFDHVIAICNGGGNREHNLQPLHVWCHRSKSARDVAERASNDRKRKRDKLPRKRSSRGFLTNRAGPFRKRMDGTVERRK